MIFRGISRWVSISGTRGRASINIQPHKWPQKKAARSRGRSSWWLNRLRTDIRAMAKEAICQQGPHLIRKITCKLSKIRWRKPQATAALQPRPAFRSKATWRTRDQVQHHNHISKTMAKSQVRKLQVLPRIWILSSSGANMKRHHSPKLAK